MRQEQIMIRIFFVSFVSFVVKDLLLGFAIHGG
jgi:hypothetical protein